MEPRSLKIITASGAWPRLTALVRAFLVNIDRRLREDWGRVTWPFKWTPSSLQCGRFLGGERKLLVCGYGHVQALMLRLRKIGEYRNYTPKGPGEIVLYFLTGVKKKSDGREGAEYLENGNAHLRWRARIQKDTNSRNYTVSNFKIRSCFVSSLSWPWKH